MKIRTERHRGLKSRLFGREANWFAYIFLLPWVAGILLLVIRPLILAIYYSFCEVNITARGIVCEWIGFDNFREIWIKDINFVEQELSFLLEVILQVPIIVIFSLLAALMLNTNLKGKGIFRTLRPGPGIHTCFCCIHHFVFQMLTVLDKVNKRLFTELSRTGHAPEKKERSSAFTMIACRVSGNLPPIS